MHQTFNIGDIVIYDPSYKLEEGNPWLDVIGTKFKIIKIDGFMLRVEWAEYKTERPLFIPCLSGFTTAAFIPCNRTPDWEI